MHNMCDNVHNDQSADRNGRRSKMYSAHLNGPGALARLAQLAGDLSEMDTRTLDVLFNLGDSNIL